MKLRAIPALVLALIATSSGAATRYDFSYTGLYYDQSWSDDQDGFFADAALTGYFVGEDTNGDGVLQAGELTDFAFGYNHGIGGETIHVIGPNVPEYCLSCQLTSFEYSPGGTLTFDAALSGVRFGQLVSDTGLWSEFYSDYWTLTVTPATVIRVAAVPEPGMGAMLAAGLLGLAYRCRPWVSAVRRRSARAARMGL